MQKLPLTYLAVIFAVQIWQVYRFGPFNKISKKNLISATEPIGLAFSVMLTSKNVKCYLQIINKTESSTRLDTVNAWRSERQKLCVHREIMSMQMTYLWNIIDRGTTSNFHATWCNMEWKTGNENCPKQSQSPRLVPVAVELWGYLVVFCRARSVKQCHTLSWM